jgi:hypothetical protein
LLPGRNKNAIKFKYDSKNLQTNIKNNSFVKVKEGELKCYVDQQKVSKLFSEVGTENCRKST